MRRRLSPRAAVTIGLLCASTLIAAAGLVRAVRVPSAGPPAPEVLPAPAPTSAGSIDATLSRDMSGCGGARSTVWNPLSGVEYTGRIRLDLPARSGGAVVLFIGDAMPLELDAETTTGDPVLMHRERLRRGPGVHVPPDFWLDDENPWSAPGHIVRATIDALPERALSIVVSLGRRAPRVLVRLIGYPPDVRVPVCAVPVREDETYFASGWYGEQAGGTTKERWMRDIGAVMVSSARDGAVTIRARARPATTTADDPTRLTLRVNDVLELPAVSMTHGPADYEWHVPDVAWVPGTNELLFSVSRTTTSGTRTIGMSLQELRLLHRE